MSSRAFLCALAIATLLAGSTALFQDEVGVFDWTKENVGVVSRAVFPANAKNVFVATDSGVLASLQLKTGAIQWRRVLSDDAEILGLAFCSTASIVVTLSNSKEGLSLHSWNVKGALLHRTVFPVPSAGAVPFMRIVEESKTGPVVAVVAGASVALVSVSNTEHVQAWAFTAPYSSVIDVVSGAVKGEPVVFIVSGEGSAESMDVFASITVQSVRASGELVSTSVNRSPALASSVVCVATVKDGTVDVLFLSPVGDSIVVYSPFSNVPTPHLLSSFLMGEAAQRRGVGLKLAAPNVLPGDKQPHHAPIVLSLMQGGDVLIGFSPNSKMASIDVGSSGETRLVSTSAAPFRIVDHYEWQSSLGRTGTFAGCNTDGGPVVLAASLLSSGNLAFPGVIPMGAFSDEAVSVTALQQSVGSVSSPAGVTGVRSIFTHVSMKTSRATVLVVWADASLSLLQSGAQVWHRPEFLGCISQLVYLDRVAVTAANADADSVTPIDMSLPGRLTLQVHDLLDTATGLVSWIAKLPLTLSRLLVPSAASVTAVRESLNPEYGFEKILVALSPLSDSSVSVISAVDSISGSLLWSVPVTVAGVAAAPVLYVTRARPFENHPPEVSVVWSIAASSYNTSVSIGGRVLHAGWSASTFVLRISALTGHVLSSQSFNIQAAQVFMLDRLLDSTHCSLLFALDAQHNHVQALFDVSPSLHDKLASAFLNTVLHTAAKLGHNVSGFKLLTTSAPDLFRVSPVWSTVLPAPQQVVQVVHGDSSAAVATAAVVLGDDSLLTKYLNPHLIAIISSSNPVEFTSGDSTIELRLVDSVSGKLVWSRVIRHASLPVHAVRQENCLITTYWNAKWKRTEVLSVAMFEDGISRYELNPLRPSKAKAVRSSYESLDPIVLQQLFVMPSGVTAAAPVRTRYGITSPHLLFGLTSGAVWSVNRLMLDPRRPQGEPSPADNDERLTRYSAFLPVTHKSVLTHSHVLPRIRSIISTPTSLESTSLVAVAGLDLMVSPVVPVTGFDRLSASFNRPLMIVIISGLALAAAALKSVLDSRQLAKRWK